MKKHPSREELLEEAKGRCAILTECLPSRVDPASISIKAKIPFKAMDYREALYYRTEEVVRVSCELYDRKELGTASLLTRACLENVAAMWYLKENIQKVIDKEEVGDIDDILMKLLHGSKNDITCFEAINVLTFIDKLSKDLPEFKKNYESLCEYSHPNWAGTAFLYSQPNTEKIWTDFGKNVRDTKSVSIIGLVNLNVSLSLFEHAYNLISEMMPGFINICEKDIEKKNKKASNNSMQ